MTSNSQMIYKLQKGLNSTGRKILWNRSQFFSEQQNRPVTIYVISESQFNQKTGKVRNVELFRSASEIQVVFFMRNLWFLQIGKEIPDTHFGDFEIKWKSYLETLDNDA